MGTNLTMSGNDLLETLNANSLFMVQCIIAACIGGLEFCFPALFVDTFNTFEVYTSHRLYGATMIVNAILVFAMRNTQDPNVKKDVIQAFLFQFGLHIIVLLRPQVWGFLTPFNKVNLLCSFGLAATYGYMLMGEKRKVRSCHNLQNKVAKKTEEDLKAMERTVDKLKKELETKDTKLEKLQQELTDMRRKGK